MNIYINAMEIGYKNSQGLTYSELKEKVESKISLSIEGKTELAFIEWVLDNFSAIDLPVEKHRNVINIFIELNKGYGLTSIMPSLREPYDIFIRSLFFIKGNVIKSYLDYLELKESRQQSKVAFIVSTVSIVIALTAIFIPLMITSDVKIVENESEDNLAEKISMQKREIDSLRNKLHEANMLIDIYETDPKEKLLSE